MEIEFTKMSAIGNDFVVVNSDVPASHRKHLAVALTRRRLGIGADGLLLIEDSSSCDARVDSYNADGSHEFCGNGIRCVAAFLARNCITQETEFNSQIVLETKQGTSVSQVLLDSSGQWFVRSQLAVPRVLEINRKLRNLVCEVPILDGEPRLVSTGSPHFVIPVSARPSDQIFFPISKRIENSVKGGASAIWVYERSESDLKIRIWERGVGETMACATGASAASFHMMLQNNSLRSISVCSSGGTLKAYWQHGEPIEIEGPVRFVYAGNIDVDENRL